MLGRCALDNNCNADDANFADLRGFFDVGLTLWNLIRVNQRYPRSHYSSANIMFLRSPVATLISSARLVEVNEPMSLSPLMRIAPVRMM